jgi:hypothetical protein
VELAVGALVYAHNVATGANPEAAIVNSTGNIVRRETTVAQQKVMGPAVSALIISHDLTLRVNRGVRSVKKEDGTWGINRCKRAPTQHIGVSFTVCALEIAHDLALGIDFGEGGEYRARGIK